MHILCLADTQLVVEAQAVAPDPSDLKQIGFIDMDGAVSACDYAGVVSKVNASSSHSFKAGDRLPASFMEVFARPGAIPGST